MKRVCVMVLLAVAFLSERVCANDAAIVGVGGSMKLLKGEHRDIQMVRELVWIEIGREYYTTTVDFEFRNHGPAQMVTMGFPESGYGDSVFSELKKRSAFHSFATWVDGKMVAAKRAMFHWGSDYHAFWIKTVAFRRHQQRRVRVRYRAWVGGEASFFKEGGGRFVNYSFTGGNWRGNVRESTLIAILRGYPFSVKRMAFHQTFPQSNSEGRRLKELWKNVKPAIVRRRGNWFRYRWTNWPAEGLWTVTFTIPKPKNTRKAG